MKLYPSQTGSRAFWHNFCWYIYIYFLQAKTVFHNLYLFKKNNGTCLEKHDNSSWFSSSYFYHCGLMGGIFCMESWAEIRLDVLEVEVFLSRPFMCFWILHVTYISKCQTIVLKILHKLQFLIKLPSNWQVLYSQYSPKPIFFVNFLSLFYFCVHFGPQVRME